MVREPTRRQRHVQNILNLVLTNNESIIQSLAVVPASRGHDIVVFNINLRASLCKILISSFAHKMDLAHNFSVDFF